MQNNYGSDLLELLSKGYLKDSDLEISDIFKSTGKYDIIDSAINTELKKIKSMIGKNLDKEKTDKIDNEFFDSLKKYFIIRGLELNDQELERLSYFYFAIYNDTLDIYYQLNADNKKIFYYMLDRQINNSVNSYYDFNDFNLNKLKLLQIAYDRDLFDITFNFLKQTKSYFLADLRDYEFLAKIFEHKSFKYFIEKLGIEFILKRYDREFYLLILEALQDDKIDYLKNLLTINPNLNLSCPIILNDKLIENFTVVQIAFFSIEQLENISHIIAMDINFHEQKNTNETKKSPLDYYKEILEINQNVIFYDDNYYLCDCIANTDLSFPAQIIAVADRDLQNNISDLCEIYSNYHNRRCMDMHELVKYKTKEHYYKSKIKHLISKETKKITDLSSGYLPEKLEDKPKQYLKK